MIKSKILTVKKVAQLIFVKANDVLKIRSISKSLKAFHIFVMICISLSFNFLFKVLNLALKLLFKAYASFVSIKNIRSSKSKENILKARIEN